MPTLDKTAAALSCAHCRRVTPGDAAAACRCCGRLRCDSCGEREVETCPAPPPWRWRFDRRGRPLQLDASGRYLGYAHRSSVRLVDLRQTSRVKGMTFTSANVRKRLRRGDREPRYAVFADARLLTFASHNKTDGSASSTATLWTAHGREARRVVFGGHVDAVALERDGRHGYARFGSTLARLDPASKQTARWSTSEAFDRPLIACDRLGRLALVDGRDGMVVVAIARGADEPGDSAHDAWATASGQPAPPAHAAPEYESAMTRSLAQILGDDTWRTLPLPHAFIGAVSGNPRWIGLGGRRLVVLVGERSRLELYVSYRADDGWLPPRRRAQLSGALACSLDASLSGGGALLAVRETEQQVAVYRLDEERPGGVLCDARLSFDREVRIVRFVDREPGDADIASDRLVIATRGDVYCWYIRRRQLVLGTPREQPPWEALK